MIPNGPAISFKEPATLQWSIIVPVHQRREPDTLRRCLESVLPQLKEGMELVVVDHSDDQCGLFVLGKLDAAGIGVSESGKRARHVTADPQGSAAADWNLALTHARGRWVHLLHDDDWVLPGFYVEPRLTDRRAEADCFYTGYKTVRAGQTTMTRTLGTVPHWPSIAMTNPLNPPCFSCRRDVYERFGGYCADPEIRYVVDWEFYVRVSHGDRTRWGHTNKVLACYSEDGEETMQGGGRAVAGLPILASLRACIEKFWRGGVEVRACRGACANYFHPAISSAVQEESLEHFWAAIAFNRLVKQMEAAK